VDQNDIIRQYSNGEISVFWQPGRCVHSGNCARGLPSVFQPKSQPWVKVDQATSKEIIAAVAKCPSGALSIQFNEKK
jgi:uncharacterized Fe-S cluster protein YjdI